MTLSKFLAREIVRGTRKSFSAMHSAYLSQLLEEKSKQKMSTPTSSTLNGGSTFVPTQKDAQPNAASEGVKPVLRGSPNHDSTTSGMRVSSDIPVSVKPVDRKTITGSTPGDFRKQASPAKLPENPNPRQPKGQTPLSGRTPAPSAPFLSDTEGTEGDRA